jgi:hypothetical protein
MRALRAAAEMNQPAIIAALTPLPLSALDTLRAGYFAHKKEGTKNV